MDKYRNEETDFTESEQVTIDAGHRTYLEKYAELDDSMIIFTGPKGDILRMFQSSITSNEWTRITQLMK